MTTQRHEEQVQKVVQRVPVFMLPGTTTLWSTEWVMDPVRTEPVAAPVTDPIPTPVQAPAAADETPVPAAIRPDSPAADAKTAAQLAWLERRLADGTVPGWLADMVAAGEVRNPQGYWESQVRRKNPAAMAFLAQQRPPQQPPVAQKHTPHQATGARGKKPGRPVFLSVVGAASQVSDQSFARSREILREKIVHCGDPDTWSGYVLVAWVYAGANPVGPQAVALSCGGVDGMRFNVLDDLGVLTVGFDPRRADRDNPCGRLTAVLHALEWDADRRKIVTGQRWVRDVMSVPARGPYDPESLGFHREAEAEFIRAALVMAHQLVCGLCGEDPDRRLLATPDRHLGVDVLVLAANLPDGSPTLALKRFGDDQVYRLDELPADAGVDPSVANIVVELPCPGYDLRTEDRGPAPGPIGGTAAWTIMAGQGTVTDFRPTGLPAAVDLCYRI